MRIWVDGEVTQTLTAAQALDPDAWGNPSPLTRLVTRLETSDRLVTGVDRGGQPTCGPGDPPASLRGQEATLIDAVGVVDGVFGCSQVRVYGTAGGVTDVTSTEWTPASDPASGRVRLEARLLDDGRRIELNVLPGESSCLEIQGIDERIRSCVPPPSERVPDVTAAIATWAIAQRSDTAPLEVYGTTSVEVTEVVVQFDSGGGPEQTEAQLLRVTDAAKLDSAGISEPFGLFFAELPPGTTAGDVNAVAFNANGEQLGTADFSHLQGQPPGAVIGGRPQS